MHQVANKQQALISILHRSYQEIREIESEYHMVIDQTDLRPRIEYFHDAVRVLTDYPDAMYAKNTRLAVEWLAWDLSCLRYISDKPLAKISHDKPMGSTQSGKTSSARGLTVLGKGEKLNPRTPPPDLRAQLSGLYKSYTVIHAALFAEIADKNFEFRTTECDTEVEDLAQIQMMIEMLERQQISEEQVEEAIQHLQDEEMKTQLMIKLHEKSQRKRKMREAIQMIKFQMQKLDVEIAMMNESHTHFLSGQMMLLQDSKDMVKTLAAQGLNMAGQYLENAVSQVQGRGAGRGF